MSFARLALTLVIASMGMTGGMAGCVSARMSDRETDRFFREGSYDQATQRLRDGLVKQGDNGRDLLLYLLDLGLTLHTSGNFEESNRYLLKADKIAEIKDYTSLSAEGATLLTSDNIKDYKGEDFEKVLINTYLAMNYALMGDYENGEVEARRVNQKLYMMVSQGQRKYKQNAFARYLSAILYEADGEYNDAYVDYKQTRDLEPGATFVGRDLWRMAYALNIEEDEEEWDQEYKLTPQDHQDAKLMLSRNGAKAEIIVLYENGISPVKRSNPQFRELPKFFPRFNPVSYAVVDVSGNSHNYSSITYKLHDIESTAIENLDEKYGGLIAKKLAGIVAKEAAGAGVEKATHSEFLGFLTKVALYASDQADLRSWNLLPRDLQISRIPVDPGTYQVKITPVGDGNGAREKTIQVGPGKKAFVDFRYVPRY